MRRATIAAAAVALSIGAAVGVRALRPSLHREAFTPIVLVVIDTLRADHLGSYGYFRDTSPELDAFSRDALLFERAMTPIGTTLPATVSLFTSTNPLEHGVLGNLAFYGKTVQEADDLRLMAIILADLGYRTGGVVSSPALAPVTGIHAGFEDYLGGEEGTIAEQTTDRALAWLDSIDTGQPFLLFVHYVDPHSPYRAPAPFAEKFHSDEGLRAHLRARGVPVRPRNLDANDRYDAEVAYVDAHVGRLLAGLRQRNLYDLAAIAVMADHGEGLGQHHWMYHGRIYGEQMRIPLLLRLPARPELRGQRYAEPASLIDVLPTLVADLALPVPDSVRAQFVGIDLLGGERRSYVYAERPRRQKRNDPDTTEHYALAGTRWKFFYNPERGDRLFDLEADPAELHNVIGEHTDVATSLRAALLAQIEEYRGRGGRLVADTKVDLPESTRDELRRLGYDF